MNTIKLEDLRSPEGNAYTFTQAKKDVVKPGEFNYAAVQFEHGHLHGMIEYLKPSGATLKWVYDKRPDVLQKVSEMYPTAKVARCLEEVLDDPEVQMVASADVPSERCALGIRCMRAGKHYFVDKTPLTSMEQLCEAKQAVAETGRKYACYFSERLCSEAASIASDLIDQGALGKIVSIIGVGPHSMGDPKNRPAWFFKRKQYGGILNDIGSHQCEQFLHFAHAKNATINFARACNMNHPDYPELEDFGESSLTADNGTSFYYRLDWFTPAGLSNWGDGRTLIVGTDAFIELRKVVDLATGHGLDQIYYVNKDKEYHINGQNTVGFPFFSEFVLDCINGTENAITQERTFKAAELCLKCQMMSDALRN